MRRNAQMEIRPISGALGAEILGVYHGHRRLMRRVTIERTRLTA